MKIDPFSLTIAFVTRTVVRIDPFSLTIAFLIFMNVLAVVQFQALTRRHVAGPVEVNFIETVQR